MENQIPNTNQPVANTPPQVPITPPTNWTKISLLVILILILMGGSVFTGIQIGKNQLKENYQTIPTPIITNNQNLTTPTSPLASNTPSPTVETNGWKTYTNSQEKYLFKYPSDWKLTKDTKNLQSIYLDKTDKTQEKVMLPGDTYKDASYSIHVWSRPNPSNLSARDFYLSSFSSDSKAQAEKNIEDIIVAGEKGILYDEGSAPSSGPEKTVLIAHKGKIFSLSYGAMAHEDTHLKFYDIFNQLLTTFEFTD